MYITVLSDYIWDQPSVRRQFLPTQTISANSNQLISETLILSQLCGCLIPKLVATENEKCPSEWFEFDKNSLPFWQL